MDVTFITTTAAKLNSIPIVDGQVIAISDESSYYYDMNNKRNRVSGTAFVSNLVGTGQENMLYVVSDPAGLYLYENGEYKSILPDAGIPDAPSDGKLYGRQDGEWAVVNIPDPGIPDAPSDGTSYVRYDANWREVECDVYIDNMPSITLATFFIRLLNKFWSLSYRKIKLNLIGNINIASSGGIAVQLHDRHDKVIEFDFSRANIVLDSNRYSYSANIVSVSGNNNVENCTIIVSNLNMDGTDTTWSNNVFNLVSSNAPITVRIKDCNLKMIENFQVVDIPANSNLFFQDCQIYSRDSGDSTNTWLYTEHQPMYIFMSGCTFTGLGFRLNSTTPYRFQNVKAIGNIVDYDVHNNMADVFKSEYNVIMQSIM